MAPSGASRNMVTPDGGLFLIMKKSPDGIAWLGSVVTDGTRVFSRKHRPSIEAYYDCFGVLGSELLSHKRVTTPETGICSMTGYSQAP